MYDFGLYAYFLLCCMYDFLRYMYDFLYRITCLFEKLKFRVVKKRKIKNNYEKRILRKKKDTFFREIETYNTKRLNFQSKTTIFY